MRKSPRGLRSEPEFRKPVAPRARRRCHQHRFRSNIWGTHPPPRYAPMMVPKRQDLRVRLADAFGHPGNGAPTPIAARTRPPRAAPSASSGPVRSGALASLAELERGAGGC